MKKIISFLVLSIICICAFSQTQVLVSGKVDSSALLAETQCKQTVEIPTSISFLKDGFKISIKSMDVDFKYLKIYNRWGEIFFETNTPNFSWDGFYKKQTVAAGMYLLKAEYVCHGVIIQRNETLTILN